MSTKILDYTLSTLTPANPDASSPATVTGCAVGAGPGLTPLGTFPQALDFNGTGHFTTTLPVASLNRTKFCVRLVFKVDQPVTGRQNLVESTILPFSMYLVPGSGPALFIWSLRLLRALVLAKHQPNTTSRLPQARGTQPTWFTTPTRSAFS